LAKGCDLMNPEDVKENIAFRQVSEAQKEKLCSVYDRYCKQHNLIWSIPRYRRITRLPFVPKQEDIIQLINALSRRQGTFVQLIMETGARAGEAWQLKWIDIDSENCQIVINSPEKNSNPRKLRVSKALIAKLNALTRKCPCVFKVQENSKFLSFARCFYKARFRIAVELKNPNIDRINFKNLRHFRASQIYAQTKDLLYTQRQLGHRSISSTMVYVHLTEFEEDGYFVVKIAGDLNEFVGLIEAGFEYISDFEGKKVCRKRK
jgi:integrase